MLRLRAENELLDWYDGKEKSFKNRLFNLIRDAKEDDLEKLRIVYPNEVEVMQLFLNNRDFISDIKERLNPSRPNGSIKIIKRID